MTDKQMVNEEIAKRIIECSETADFKPPFRALSPIEEVTAIRKRERIVHALDAKDQQISSLQAKVERLMKALEKTPHSQYCSTNIIVSGGLFGKIPEHPFPCDCYKQELQSLSEEEGK